MYFTRNHVHKFSTVSGNPTSDRGTVKLTDMEQTILPNKRYGRTAQHDSQPKEVLFFADPHFLFFNFMATAHLAHLVLPDTQASASQNQKS